MNVQIHDDGTLHPGEAKLGGHDGHFDLTWTNGSNTYPAKVMPPGQKEWTQIFTDPYPGVIALNPGQTSPTYTLLPEPRNTGRYPYQAQLDKVKADGNIRVDH